MNKIIEIKIPCKALWEMNYYFVGTLFYHFLYSIQNLPNILYALPGPKIICDSTSLNPFKYFVSFHEAQMFDSRQNVLFILTTAIKDYLPNTVPSTYVNYVEYKFKMMMEKLLGLLHMTQ